MCNYELVAMRQVIGYFARDDARGRTSHDCIWVGDQYIDLLPNLPLQLKVFRNTLLNVDGIL